VERPVAPVGVAKRFRIRKLRDAPPLWRKIAHLVKPFVGNDAELKIRAEVGSTISIGWLCDTRRRCKNVSQLFYGTL
jgi:hypothetical protein